MPEGWPLFAERGYTRIESGGVERGGATAANSCDYGARGKLVAKRERSTGAKHETLTDRLQDKYDRAIPREIYL